MDWLRIGAFGSLIFYHIGMIFVPWDFHINAEPPVDWLQYPMLALNPWRLSLLFLVSGFASRNLLEKLHSARSFMSSRAKRLFIPLVFGMAIIMPPQPWVELMVKHGYTESYWHFFTTEYFQFDKLNGLDLPTWNHLWFVAYLFVYTMLLSLAAFVLMGRGGWLQRSFDRVFSGYGLLVWPLAVIIAIRLILYPVYDESHAMVGDWAAHALYGSVFLFGFGLARSAPAWQAIRDHRKIAYKMAFIGGAIFVVMGPIPNEQLNEAWIIFGRVARSVFAWGMIVSMIAIADRWWNHDHPSRMMWVEAVFPFYIIHQSIIILTYWWLLPFNLYWAIDFAIVVGATVIGCWFFYRIGREIPGLRLLIGLAGWRQSKRV